MAGVAEIRETVLPGVGYCHDFPTRAGPRVGVVTRTTGRRELIVYSQEDPDAVEHHVDLDPEEARVLGELLGVSSVTQQIGNISGLIEGLAIDWIPLGAGFVPSTIGDLAIRSRTGASVVAVVRGGRASPAPGPEHRLEPGDTVVVVGTPEGLEAAGQLLAP